MSKLPDKDGFTDQYNNMVFEKIRDGELELFKQTKFYIDITNKPPATFGWE